MNEIDLMKSFLIVMLVNMSLMFLIFGAKPWKDNTNLSQYVLSVMLLSVVVTAGTGGAFLSLNENPSWLVYYLPVVFLVASRFVKVFYKSSCVKFAKRFRIQSTIICYASTVIFVIGVLFN